MTNIKTIRDIGREVLTAEKTPLTTFQKEVILMLLMLELSRDNSVPPYNPFLHGVIEKRLAAHYGADQRITPQLSMLLEVAADRPGTVLLLLAGVLAVDTARRPIRLIDLWPHVKDGLPTEAALHRIWDGQKTAGGANMIDLPECWA